MRDRRRRSEKGPHQFCTKLINPIESAHAFAYCKENNLPPTVSSTIRPHTDYSDRSCWKPWDNSRVVAATGREWDLSGCSWIGNKFRRTPRLYRSTAINEGRKPQKSKENVHFEKCERQEETIRKRIAPILHEVNQSNCIGTRLHVLQGK